LAAAALASIRPPSQATTTARPDKNVVIGDSTNDTAFTRSLVYSGAGALAIAAAGLIFLGSHRRFW
jgi:hypothetical protein